MSTVVIFLTTVFAIVKLQFLMLRKKPNVIELMEPSAFDLTHRYNTESAENDFMMAVSVERHQKGARMDPRYVQFVATLITSTADSFEEIYVPMKPCTDQ